MFRWIAWMPVALVACGPAEVTVRVAIPGPDSVLAAVAGVQLIALPYDRDSVIAALEAQSAAPARETHALDSLYGAFRAPFAAYAQAALRVRRLEDSLAAIRADLDSIPRNASAYRSLYLRFTELADTLARAQAASERAQAVLKRARDTLGGRIERLRAAHRRWEDTTYHGYDSLTTALVRSRGLTPIADTTDAEGRAAFRLLPGRWWIYARSWDAEDPYSEWYWNVPVRGDSLILDPANGRRRPTY